MIKKLLSFLFLLSFIVSSPCLAEEEYRLIGFIDEYAASSNSKKVEMANQLFESFQDQIDTLYCFSPGIDQQYLDAMVYYYCALDAYEVSFDYEHAAIWCHQAEVLSEKSDSVFMYGDCIALAACIYIRLSDFSQAIEYAERSLELDRLTGDATKISSSLNNAAAIYICANRSEVAEKYMMESVKIERTLDRPRVLSSRLGLAAETFIQEGKYQEAYDCALEALELARSLDKPNLVATRQSQMGLALFHMNRFEEARSIMLQAVDTLIVYRNKNSLCITYRQLSSLEQTLGNDERAIDYLQRSMEISRQLGNKMHTLKECKQLAELLKKRDPVKAIEYLEQSISLNEEIYNDKMTMQLQASNVRYQTAEMKHQIDIQDNKLLLHRIMTIVSVIVLLALLFAVFSLLRLAKERKKANQILQQASAAKDELLRIANAEKLQAESARQQILEVADHISSLSALSETELTSREVQIIRLYSKGLMSKEVAEQLNISVRTVESHKNHIYRKLGISTTVELLRFAQQKGIV